MNDFNCIENLENKLNKEKNDNFLDNIKNYTFFIQYNNEKQKYELKSIIFNEKELLNAYKEFIEKSFFSISHSIDENNFNNEYHISLKKIIEINNDIIILTSLLNKQRTILYESKNYELIIKEENLFDTKENKIVKTIIKEYKIKEEEEKNILTQNYSENIIISFFYGRQFSYLFNLIDNENYENIKYFIPFYFINSITSFKPNKKFIKENKIYNFKGQLEILSNYFKEIFEKNEINIKNLFDKIIIKDEIKFYIRIF